MIRSRRLTLAVSVAFTAIFAALALRNVDLNELRRVLAASSWWPWYALAPAIYMAGHFVRGVRCRAILKPHCQISTWTASNVIIIGYAANNVLPARMGEIVRAYVLGRKARLSISLSLAVTLLERIFDGLVITGILVIAGRFAPLPTWGNELLGIASGVFVAATVGLVLMTVAESSIMKLADWLSRPLPTRIATRVLGILGRAMLATRCLRNPALLARIAVLSVMVWVVEGAMFLVVLPAFELPADPVRAAMALSVTNLGILVPSSPGYVGPFHFFCMRALLIFEVTRETALGYALMVHILYYLPVTLWGLAALGIYGISLHSAASEPLKTLPAEIRE